MNEIKNTTIQSIKNEQVVMGTSLAKAAMLILTGAAIQYYTSDH